MIRDKRTRRRPAWGACLLAFAFAAMAVGCDGLIDVENPNNVGAEDVVNPEASSAVANGSLYTLQDGYNYMLLVYCDVADECTWVGSRDAFNELDLGTPDNPANEFTDQAYVKWAASAWMTQEAIRVLEQHRADGTLEDETDLARAYLYAAMHFTTAADFQDDHVIGSDMREAAPPVGPDNMNTLYTQALAFVDEGLAIVSGAGGDVERNLTAMRARIQFSNARWDMVGRVPISVTNNGLITSGGAAGDAAAALAIDDTDWVFELDYDASTAFNIASFAINSRLELRFSDDYIIPREPERKIRARTMPDPSDPDREIPRPDRGISLVDPVTGSADLRLADFMEPFEDADNFAELPYLTAREMRLIMAEDELATNGNTATFQGLINDVRGAGGAANWDGTTPSARDIVIHERRVNLYLMGHRLNDMYRFGIQSTNWQPNRPAVTTPGTFLPITKTEIDANCHLSPDFECPS